MDEVGEWQEESSWSEGGWSHVGPAAPNQTGRSLQAGTDPHGEQGAFNRLHADN